MDEKTAGAVACLVEAEAARLESLGATRLRTIVEESLDHYAVALSDHEGNEFDIN